MQPAIVLLTYNPANQAYIMAPAEAYLDPRVFLKL